MSRRPTRHQLVRGWLHDRVCMSECTGDQRADHARRTQHEQARQLLACTSIDDVLGLVHAQFCRAAWDTRVSPDGCPVTEQHLVELRDKDHFRELLELLQLADTAESVEAVR